MSFPKSLRAMGECPSMARTLPPYVPSLGPRSRLRNHDLSVADEHGILIDQFARTSDISNGRPLMPVCLYGGFTRKLRHIYCPRSMHCQADRVSFLVSVHRRNLEHTPHYYYYHYRVSLERRVPEQGSSAPDCGEVFPSASANSH
jgi:hypothetical protein